jgi:hypothetical protein
MRRYAFTLNRAWLLLFLCQSCHGQVALGHAGHSQHVDEPDDPRAILEIGVAKLEHHRWCCDLGAESGGRNNAH